MELRSAETLRLFQELQELYKLHGDVGVPIGHHEFVAADPAIAQLSKLAAPELRTYLSANEQLGSSLLGKLLTWAVEGADPEVIVRRLVGLEPESLQSLNAAVGLQNLKSALSLWTTGEHRSDEGFWQNTIAQHSHVLERVLAWPVTVVEDQAYVGGKALSNKKGNVVDFLIANHATQNVALLEIKTPDTKLLQNKPYRGRVYNVSSELTGSVQQVSNYRLSLEREFDRLSDEYPDLICFAPKCVVIIGDTAELDEKDKKGSFELFRGTVSTVEIVTFDELFGKTQKLIELLEATGPTES